MTGRREGEDTPVLDEEEMEALTDALCERSLIEALREWANAKNEDER